MSSQEPVFSNVPSAGFPDPYPWGQCTYWADYNTGLPGNLGNGGEWVANAIRENIPVSKTPQVGDVVGYQGGGYSSLGHVAVVTDVNSNDNTFQVSEMNYKGLGIVDTRQDSLTDPAIQGFITTQETNGPTTSANLTGSGSGVAPTGFLGSVMDIAGALGMPTQDMFVRGGLIVIGLLFVLMGLVIAFHGQIERAMPKVMPIPV